MIENWKDIIDYPNYKISNSGIVINKITNRKISISIHKHGHHVVRLWNNNKSKLFKLYRLLAIHFIPNPENKREVNHIDGNRMNLNIDNLEWATPSENMKHAFLNGLSKGQFKKGFNHQLCKIKIDDVQFIIEKRKNKEMSLKELGIKFNVTPDHICKISKGKMKYEVI